MFNPIFISQTSPVSMYKTHYVKACQDIALEFEYDLIGEPKLPRRALVALVSEDELLHVESDPVSWLMDDRSVRSLKEGVNDRYSIFLTLSNIGNFVPVVFAWVDEVDRLVDLANKKSEIHESIELELGDIASFFEQHLASNALMGWPTDSIFLQELEDLKVAQKRRSYFEVILESLRDSSLDQRARLDLVSGDTPESLVHMPTRQDLVSFHIGQVIRVERAKAGFSSWYELFPRSYDGFLGVIGELDRIASMGFDVVYLPPIHPVGTINRKGPNNALVAQANDVGSPWAIGSQLGGHSAINPGLGTEEDFTRLVDCAAEKGIEIAIDIALQCAPDHPWVKEHPDWFVKRSTGEIAFAENPPKKYQDIYAINFFVENLESRNLLYVEIYDVFKHWILLGVKIFRVDNPHTKALPFWEWICAKMRSEYPDVIFLAEAFTAPKLMYRLGEIGFSQSYTYFTWRTTKSDLASYGSEMASNMTVATMRPNFWPNTPDILAHPLRGGNRAHFFIRAVLAATMTTSWGIYSGFELFENTPVFPDSEEYLDSEKYQIRRRDFNVSESMTNFIGVLNKARLRNPAIGVQRGFLNVDTDSNDIFAYLRFDPIGGNRVLVVVNLNATNPSECQLDLRPLREKFGLDSEIAIKDILTGEVFIWTDQFAYVYLDPIRQVAHLFEFV